MHQDHDIIFGASEINAEFSCAGRRGRIAILGARSVVVAYDDHYGTKDAATDFDGTIDRPPCPIALLDLAALDGVER
jgi:hypothetical protein